MYTLLQIFFCFCLAATGFFSTINGYKNGLAGADKKNGIVYFSLDNAVTWHNNSKGLPPGINLTDIVANDKSIFITTKQHGIFTFDFQNESWENMLGKPFTSRDIDVINIYKDEIVAGTGGDGIFMSSDNGRTWTQKNKGLGNLTVRRLVMVGNLLLAGTNGGLYSWDEIGGTWKWFFGFMDLQVNGITEFQDEIYAATNIGIFKMKKDGGNPEHIMKHFSLHNISADTRLIYAMAYNEMFASDDKGKSWPSIQSGIPNGWYTFQVKPKSDAVFAAQWDGVYKRKGPGKWERVSNGMPEKFPVTELAVFKDVLVAASSGWSRNR